MRIGSYLCFIKIWYIVLPKAGCKLEYGKMKFKKIHIFAAPGSGKSYLAKKIAECCQYPRLDLDDIFWDSNAEYYGIKNNPEKRNLQLAEFLKNKQYVVEGVYYEWLKPSFDAADVIVILKVNVWKRTYHILKRFFERKWGIIQGKKATVASTIRLLKWNFKFEKRYMDIVYSMLAKDKIAEFTSADEALFYILNQKN